MMLDTTHILDLVNRRLRSRMGCQTGLCGQQSILCEVRREKSQTQTHQTSLFLSTDANTDVEEHIWLFGDEDAPFLQ